MLRISVRVIHNCLYFHKCTKSTLFWNPLPSSLKRTSKNVHVETLNETHWHNCIKETWVNGQQWQMINSMNYPVSHTRATSLWRHDTRGGGKRGSKFGGEFVPAALTPMTDKKCFYTSIAWVHLWPLHTDPYTINLCRQALIACECERAVIYDIMDCHMTVNGHLLQYKELVPRAFVKWKRELEIERARAAAWTLTEAIRDKRQRPRYAHIDNWYMFQFVQSYQS